MCFSGCDSPTAPADATAIDAASTTCDAGTPPTPEYHLHVDADRDGIVDADRTGIDSWHWGAGQKGAIILCNNDDDGGASRSDNADDRVNGGNDATELAPLVIRRIGPPAPAGWEGYLGVLAADKMNIRIFDSRSAGGREIIGPSTGNSYRLPDLAFTEKEFGMEAVRYAGSGFSGEVGIALVIKNGGSVLNVETAKVRVAPWMMPSHRDNAQKVFVCQLTVDGPTGPIPNARFRNELNTFVTAAGCTLQTHVSGDRWMQDCMEFGYASSPATGFRAVMQSPQDRGLKIFPPTLRAADFGHHTTGLASPDTTFDSTGNLEVTPPVTSRAGKAYPWGRIYYGAGRPAEEIYPKTKEFLHAQIVQDPIDIDTDWLNVGHVDEIISFVPAPGPKGFKLLLASPRRAYRILRDNRAAHGSSKLLVGRKFPPPSASPAGPWRDAEVSIRGFLDVGIPSLSLTHTALRNFNDRAQLRLDGIRSRMKNELGLTDADIIGIPILFMPAEDAPTFADALTAGMVNMLVLNRHCIIPKPFGPEVAGGDLFQRYVESMLNPLGLTLHFLDDWYEYHVGLGEVHCGTNTLRTPTAARWWEFVP